MVFSTFLKNVNRASCKIQLPKNIKAHSVFHVSALESYNEPEKCRHSKRLGPIIIEGNTDWEAV
ncbi:hypothetical protein BKA69DRAFT_1103500 [Paraphysoderma sedebokerense]|nr:hypothetical protein BKA69DRAFT_1103500 [Paraphysoderma sedebokerense]